MTDCTALVPCPDCATGLPGLDEYGDECATCGGEGELDAAAAAPIAAERAAQAAYAATLHQAATRLRERAGHATPGRWEHSGEVMHGDHVDALNPDPGAPDFFVAWTGDPEGEDDEPTNSHADAEYIAALGPHIGLLLADALDAAAKRSHEFTLATPTCPGHKAVLLHESCDRELADRCRCPVGALRRLAIAYLAQDPTPTTTPAGPPTGAH
jgi:hypothetical protein